MSVTYVVTLLCVERPLVVGCVAVHPFVTHPQGSSHRCAGAAERRLASQKAALSWGFHEERENRSFPAEWACCSALPVCVEFRWEGERVLLLAGGFLTTINLGVWAINIMFPPITVSLPGKHSGHTVCKAEFMVTLVGGGGFVWSLNKLLWF